MQAATPQARGVCNGRKDVLRFQRRVIVKNLLMAHYRCHWITASNSPRSTRQCRLDALTPTLDEALASQGSEAIIQEGTGGDPAAVDSLELRGSPVARQGISDRHWHEHGACLEQGPRGARPSERDWPALRYLTTSFTLSEWLLNSGAYMHWTVASPLSYSPRS